VTTAAGVATMNLSMLEFELQQTWQAICRNGLMSLAASSNMTVALAVLSAFFMATYNIEHMAHLEAQKATITVEVAADADPGEVERALLGDERVKSTKYVTKDEALQDLATRYGWDAESLKELGNPLPDSVIATVNDPQDIAAAAADAAKIKGVTEGGVRYGGKITDKLLVLARGIRTSGVVMAILMGFATLLIVSTTIRLTIYARRREIRIMQLVGATSWFIRLPFLIEGAFHGVVGGVLATALVLASYAYVNDYIGQNLDFVNLVYTTKFMILFGLGTLLCGILFGAAGSYIGIHRYLTEA